MPFTIIYTEAPHCAYCGKKMTTWTAFAEVHYHPECSVKKCVDEIVEKLQHIIDSYKTTQK